MKIALTPTTNQVNAFNDNLSKEKVVSTRVIAIVGSLLFLFYSVIDFFGLPQDSFSLVLLARVVNVCILATAFYLTFKACFHKHYNKILLFGYYASGITICLGIYLSKPAEYSYDSYFAALMILVITCCSWSYLPIKQATLMSLIFVAVYVLIKLIAHQANHGEELLTLIAHSFFLISAVLIASIAQCIRDSVIYRNLKLQEDLKDIIGETTREAKRQKKLANLDSLTGIPNRRYVTKQLQKSIGSLDQSTKELVVIFIDLNGFKAINDNFGHDAGDKVLEVTAKRLQQLVSVSDCLARLGGDEFLLGVEIKKNSVHVIEEMVESIKEKVAAPIAFNGDFLQVGVSVGCANFPKDGEAVNELIKAADANMYADKRIRKDVKVTRAS